MTRAHPRLGLRAWQQRSRVLGYHGWLLVALAILAVSCVGDQDATSTADIESQIPRDDLLEAGAGLYAASCAECHGADLTGTDRGPSHLSIVYEPSHHSDAAFALAVKNGVRAHHWDFGPMLPVEGLSKSDVEAIVAFVRNEQRREGFEPYP